MAVLCPSCDGRLEKIATEYEACFSFGELQFSTPPLKTRRFVASGPHVSTVTNIKRCVESRHQHETRAMAK